MRRILDFAAEGAIRAWISVVNVGEVLYVTERRRGPNATRAAIALLDALPVRVVDAGRELTFAAAHIKASHSLSYADAFEVAWP